MEITQLMKNKPFASSATISFLLSEVKLVLLLKLVLPSNSTILAQQMLTSKQCNARLILGYMQVSLICYLVVVDEKILMLFVGGDLAGNGTTVEAANDGKMASWHIHKYLQSLHKLTVPETPQLPLFCTPVDEVGIFLQL